MAAFAPPTSPTVSAAHNRATPPPVRRNRTNSITQSFLDTNPHYGICAATGDALASAPSLKTLRRNSLGSVNSGGSRGAQRRGSSISAASPGGGGPIREEGAQDRQPVESLVTAAEKTSGEREGEGSVHEEEEHEGQPHWWAVTKSGLHAFWKWFITPLVCSLISPR